MDPTTQRGRAERFRALHGRGRILILANAWDVASARLFEVAGFPAVGTTSAGVAWSYGYPDGQKIPFELIVDTTRRVAESVSVPVTADIEHGFSNHPDEVERAVARIIEAGAIGLNLEDASDEPGHPLVSVADMVAKIRAARRAGERTGVPVFVNARTDVYFLGLDDAARVRETKERFSAYAEAGADGVFAPGLTAKDEIVEILESIRLPLNVYALPGLPPAAELERLGVARVSVGCGPMQATLATLREIANELKASGSWESFSTNWMSVRELNALFETRT